MMFHYEPRGHEVRSGNPWSMQGRIVSVNYDTANGLRAREMEMAMATAWSSEKKNTTRLVKTKTQKYE